MIFFTPKINNAPIWLFGALFTMMFLIRRMNPFNLVTGLSPAKQA
jgi:hypothetical protein